MKHFGTLWENLTVHVENVQAHTPRITKDISILKWIETFGNHLYRSIGDYKIPLIYDVRILVHVPGIYPLLKSDQLYSEEFGSLDEDLITCASHDHSLFLQCIADVYYMLEEDTRGTIYAYLIQPFKNGRTDKEPL